MKEHYIDTPEALDRAVDASSRHAVLGVDTESNSMYRYFESVCFLQVRAGDDIFLVDTVALDDIGGFVDVFEDRDIIKVLHGADYDVVCLKRDYGVHFAGVFDTMIAAQCLGRERVGLAALVQDYFDVELDKSLTRHDWGARPLENKYMKYLSDDVIFLAELRDRLDAELEDADVREEAMLEFDRVCTLEWKPRDLDPEGWRKIKGSRDLDHAAQTVLKALFLVRDAIARDMNRPTFKVVGNDALLEISRRKPRRLDQLSRIRAFPQRMVKKHGRRFLEAVEDARSGKVTVERKRPRAPRRPDAEVRREQDLRKWRQAEAEKRGCPTLVVLPNHAMLEIARSAPGSLEELREVPWIGEKRIERYGEAILGLV